jgi:hypothetical protein
MTLASSLHRLDPYDDRAPLSEGILNPLNARITPVEPGTRTGRVTG